MVVLDGSGSPLGEGWSLNGIIRAESDVVTDGSVLSLNTIGTDPAAIMAFYRDLGIVPGFAVEIRLRVLEVPVAHDQYDAPVGLYGGFDWRGALESQGPQAVYFDEDSVGWGDDSQSSPMNTTDAFHIYRLEVSPTGRALLRIDGLIALMREGFAVNGVIAFGDNTGDAGRNARFQIDYITVLRDCNQNGTSDELDLLLRQHEDCNGNALPDECEPDCNDNGVADDCDIDRVTSLDCNANTVPDECDIRDGTSNDCDGNGIPIECDLASGLLEDANSNGLPDVCEIPVVYVNALAGPGGDGLSWTNAFRDLEDALDFARHPLGIVGQIWVAAGTYFPSQRTATFRLVDGVSLYGGFAGWESSIEERDIDGNRTILSGDFNGDDADGFVNYQENARHVVTAIDLHSPALVDGLTLTAGQADFGGGLYLRGLGATIRNCTFTRNFAGAISNTAHVFGGGAVYAQLRSDCDAPQGGFSFEDCRFTDNKTAGTGAAVFLVSGDASFVNCVFQNNFAGFGGAIGTEKAQSVTLRSCVFSDNESEIGGALAGSHFCLHVEDCRFQRNRAQMGGAIHHYGGVITIMNSSFSENTSNTEGGALDLHGESISLTDCVFSSNTAQFGGGAYLGAWYPTSLSRCTFRGNTANVGGGLYLESGDAVVIEGCHFSKNDAQGDGGGLYSQGSLRVANCGFGGNSALSGGAVAFSDGQALFRTSIFEHNVGDIGGAITAGAGQATLERCDLQWNSADVGGALAALEADSEVELTSSLVASNEATAYGGGIAAGAGPLSIDNCTIANNTAGVLGGGIIVGEETNIENSIVWGNAADGRTDENAQIEGIELATINYSDVEDWSGAYGGEGNIGDDPLFVDPFDPDGPRGPVEADFRLRPESPCINAGLEPPIIDWAPGLEPPPARDLDGHARVLCGVFDMGAYEFGIGDYNCNQAVDAADFAGWSGCETGPIYELDDPPYKSIAPCNALDFDADGDVDLRDLAGFQRVFGGP
jgi:hypothetical protein